jgi:hypothetical protein
MYKKPMNGKEGIIKNSHNCVPKPHGKPGVLLLKLVLEDSQHNLLKQLRITGNREIGSRERFQMDMAGVFRGDLEC